MLHGGQTPCPAPPAPSPPAPRPEPPHKNGCWRGAIPPCVYYAEQCPTTGSVHWQLKPAAAPSRELGERKSSGGVRNASIVHAADGLCLSSRDLALPETLEHTQLEIVQCNASDLHQQWEFEVSGHPLQNAIMRFTHCPSCAKGLLTRTIVRGSQQGGLVRLALDRAWCLNVGVAKVYEELQLYSCDDKMPNSIWQLTLDHTLRAAVAEGGCVDVCQPGSVACGEALPHLGFRGK